MVLSHLLNLSFENSPFETDLVVDAAPFVSDTCRMKTVAGLINHYSGIADRPNVCFVPAMRGAGLEPLPRMKLPMCFLVALEDIPPSTEVVVDYGESYLADHEELRECERQVKLAEHKLALQVKLENKGQEEFSFDRVIGGEPAAPQRGRDKCNMM